MSYDFDSIIDRRGTNSIKWQKYPQEVLPLWVADMDFAAPEPILAALQRYAQHAALGYESPSRELFETVAARMQKLYGWQVSPEAILATPGVVAGFTAAARAVCNPGQGILIQPPVYPPFLKVHETAHLLRQDAPLVMESAYSQISYSIDFEGFRKAFHSNAAQTAMFLLCNPHNPIGQVYSKDYLRQMADLCLKHNVVICSDEIHSELLLDGATHTPIAALDPEIAERTITLVAPSKTFNVPGLFCGFAIIPNKDLFERYCRTLDTLAMHVSSPGLVAARLAFSGDCDEWLSALRLYLTANRNFLVEFVKNKLKGMKMTIPQATYLAWLDCTALVDSGRITGTPYEFFLKHAKVALNEGSDFGAQAQGFVRLNFGCPRSTLVEALERMKTALA